MDIIISLIIFALCCADLALQHRRNKRQAI